MRRTLLALLAVAVVLGACGDDGDDTAAGANGAEDGDAAADDASELTVTQVDVAFQPEEIMVDAGQTVGVKITNAGALPHTFTIDDLGIDEELGAGEEVSVQLSLPEDLDTLVYYCRFHVDQGMDGELIARAAGGGEGEDGSSAGVTDEGTSGRGGY